MGEIEQVLGSYHTANLVGLSTIKYGHIVNLFKCTPHQRNKARAILQQLPSSVQETIFEDMITHIIEEYRKLNKSRSKPAGQRALIGFFSHELCEVGEVDNDDNYDHPMEGIQSNRPQQDGHNVEQVSRNVEQVSSIPREQVSSRTSRLYKRLNISLQKQVDKLKYENSKLQYENRHIKVNMSKLKVSRRQIKCQAKKKKLSYSEEKDCLTSNLKLSQRRLERCRVKLGGIKEIHQRELQQMKFKLKMEIKHLKKKLKATLDELQRRHVDIMEQDDEINYLRNDIAQEPIYTKDGRIYSLPIRKAVYHCARRQVPVGHISSVISSCVRLVCGKDLTPMPHASTVINMIGEMKIHSMCQAVEAILDSDYVNIAWDATTIKTDHINEIHVNTDSGSYMLDYKALGRYDNVGYSEHILSVLKQCAECYSNSKKSANGQIPDEYKVEVLLSRIHGKITSTLSDRAAVNKKVSAKLSEALGRNLLDLNCNIHPLDSLSIAYRGLAKSFEKDEGCTSALSGQTSILERLILIISKIKYKEGSGDPCAFRAYLEIHNIDKNLIPRYIGNRFHVLFAMCANIFYLRDSILDFLRTTCDKDYAKEVIKALESKTVIMELIVGGLFGKCLTGPWMKVLYRNSDISNLESGKILEKAVSNLKRLSEDPSLLWTASFDCFDRTVESILTDPIRLALCTTDEMIDEKLKSLTRLTANAFLVVINRQAKDYLDSEDGALYELPPERFVLGTNAPADNMTAESILALADNFKRKSPNATDTHIAAKIGFAHNGTSDWLDKIDNASMCQSISFARNFRQMRRLDTKAVRLEIAKRVKLRAQKRMHSKINIKTLIENPGTFKQQLCEKDLGIEMDRIDDASELVRLPDTLVGRQLVWIWNEEGKDKAYHYRVTGRKTGRNNLRFEATFFAHGQSMDDSDRHDFNLTDFLSDLLIGDAFFECD